LTAAEFRIDPVQGRTVILAPQRGARPGAFVRETAALAPVSENGSAPGSSADCPFCPHNEHLTPAELCIVPHGLAGSGGPRWQIRVIPNKFPALESDAPLREPRSHDEPRSDHESRSDHEQISVGAIAPGFGRHEVILETPAHVVSVTDLSPGELGEVFGIYQARLAAAREDSRIRAGILFKNVGADAGASLEHTHSQLLALPLVPPEVQARVEGAKRHFAQTGTCVYCDLLAAEAAARARLVRESPRFQAWCPFASRLPYEMWIVPRAHAADILAASSADLRELGEVVHDVLTRLEGIHGRVPYNYVLHSGPFDSDARVYYHWHLEILPRLTRFAGFEWGAGLCINPVAPETAAAQLRDAASTRSTA